MVIEMCIRVYMCGDHHNVMLLGRQQREGMLWHNLYLILVEHSLSGVLGWLF